MYNELIKETGNYNVYAHLDENSVYDRTSGADAYDSKPVVTGQLTLENDMDRDLDYIDFQYNSGTGEFNVAQEGYYTNAFYRANVERQGGRTYLPSDIDEEAIENLKETLVPELDKWIEREQQVSIELNQDSIIFDEGNNVVGELEVTSGNDSVANLIFTYDIENGDVEIDNADSLSYPPAFAMAAYEDIADYARTAAEQAVECYPIEYDPADIELSYDMQDVSRDFGRNLDEPMIVAGTMIAKTTVPEIGEQPREIARQIDFTYDMKDKSLKLLPSNSVTHDGNDIVNQDPVPSELNEPEVIESLKEAFGTEIESWARAEMDVTIDDITVDLSEPGWAAGSFMAVNGNMTWDDADRVSYEYNINEGTMDFGNMKMGPAPQYIYANFDDIESQVRDAVIFEQDRELKVRDEKKPSIEDKKNEHNKKNEKDQAKDKNKDKDQNDPDMK